MEVRKNVMVLAEVRHRTIHNITFEMLTWGRILADKLKTALTCVLIGTDQENFNELMEWGADRLLVLNNSRPDNFLITPAASLLVSIVREEQPDIVIAPATTFGRTIMPIAAARLDTGLTADCTGLGIDPKDQLLLQTRPAIGGNIMATIKTTHTKPQMATVRPRSIKPVKPVNGRQGKLLFKNYTISEKYQEKLISFIRSGGDGINLENADIVITGGIGMRSKENFRLLEKLAGLTGAGLGATRNAVEAGWAPFARQIGLTGKTVSPKVYIAAGVSGKIQHLAGMITSEFVIAINDDPEAQMFKVADLGIVGDAPTIVNKLIEAVNVTDSKYVGGELEVNG
ncbi:electron transfer flavoprotein subunit alpha/FixB family protein [Desulfoscipio sp. XC116]|uniref:electron transfer flavoprotein subunit alpha/FixB family protein n=1 Tax=Desulfoscipio sp. XC116 TaxID=3144975 RepID=UPI00325C0CE7